MPHMGRFQKAEAVEKWGRAFVVRCVLCVVCGVLCEKDVEI